jgi:hypothetical protein
VAAAGLVILAATAYAYFVHNVFSISGAVGALIALVLGGIGFLASS